jgi:hypothetical protein
LITRALLFGFGGGASGCLAGPLKRIYKASQEKKERTRPKGAEWFLFLRNSTQ